MSTCTEALCRLRHGVLGCVLVAAGALLLCAPPALALSKHVFSTSFAGSGSNALSNPSDVEVDQSTGDVYVTDPANFRVEKFTASGEFLLMFGKEVNKTKVEAAAPEAEQNICTATSGDTCQAGTKGSVPGAFDGEFEGFVQFGSGYKHIIEERLFLAVDNSGGPSNGDLYVGDPGDSLVQKFDSEGNLITSWGKGGQLDGAAPDEKKFFPEGLTGIAVDPSGTLYVFGGVDQLFEFAQDGTPTSWFYADLAGASINGIAVDAGGNFYIPSVAQVFKFSPDNNSLGSVSSSASAEIFGLRTDPASRDLYLTRFHVTEHDGSIEHLAAACNPKGSVEAGSCEAAESFGAGTLDEPRGVAIDDATGAAYVADTGNSRVAVFTATPYLPDATASAEALTPANEALEGEVDPAAAGPIEGCQFEWGVDEEYEPFPEDIKHRWTYTNTAPCEQNASLPFTGAEPTQVSAELSGLTYGTTYHFRLAPENANGANPSFDRTFESLPLAPSLEAESVSGVNSDTARIHAQINPNGGNATYHTTYRVEYVDQEGFETGEFSKAAQSKSADAGSARTPQPITAQLSSLAPDTTYHYRVVAENASGTTKGPGRTFTTFPTATPTEDPCPNAHVRQQTGAARLLDCRAYELVSAPDAGGYDVASSLVAGQEPFGGYPEAPGRVLYGVHGGGIPGAGHPTNRGTDPYLATRTNQGWSTEYVGIPANATPSASPFASTLADADASLSTFAFGGAGICSPCFADGSSGTPLHLPSGELIQGMAGSIPKPSAEPAGFIGKRLSADGTHFIFGSTSKFEPDANEGEISIYDRNLQSEETHVVSKLPAGGNLPCLTHCSSDGIGELGISKDGSRIVVGQLVEELEGAKYWHLYMNVGDSGETIDLTPGTTHGVLYDGMTADGSKVFFTTRDRLATATNQDTDESADVYMWSQQGEEAGEPLTRVSTGSEGAGNTDSCDPAANTKHEHWNTTGSEESCGVVAVGGGGGVASGDGTIYFLSPEKLDGGSNGVQNAPNLYEARPGQAPHFVTTLESSSNAPLPKKEHHLLRSFGSFTKPVGVAIDHQSADAYVLDVANTGGEPGAFVQKFGPAGNLIASFAGGGTLDGSSSPEGAFADFGIVGLPTQIAVDNSGGLSNGDLYVPDLLHNVVDKFSPSGVWLSQLSVELPTGVSVDQANGHVYVISFSSSTVSVFDATGAAIPSASFSTKSSPTTGIAVDSGGTVYVANGGALNPEGAAEAYDSSGTFIRQVDANPSFGVAVDPSNDHVYVDEGKQAVELESSANENEQVGAPIGSGLLSGSIGLAADEGNLDLTNPGVGKVASFGPALRLPDPETDSPLVIDSVSSPGSRHTADFQVTPDGEYAAFGSTLPLAPGADTGSHTQVYRYASASDALACVSCLSTGVSPDGDASLAPDGLSLSGDGRVFFDSAVALVNSDTDNRLDAYQWEPQGTGNCSSQSPALIKAAGACLALISAGTSPFDSGLLSATSNGKDAFFFTRDSLAPQDENGTTMKIYDAREGGGFPFSPKPNTCQASDECHGAASPSPAPVEVGSVAGTPGNATEARKCKKGLVKRHGACVKLHKHKHRHHRRANPNRGGHK